MNDILPYVFAPGLFESEPVRSAIIVGALVAIVSGLVGVFTVMRRQSFAGHALADLGAVGGSAAYLLGISQLWGFVGAGILAAGLMELVGIKRAQGRDVATGIIFGFGLGLTALFLYWDTTLAGSSNAAVSVLFGSLFVLNPAVIPLVLVLSLIACAIIVLIYRWLLIDSISQDLAAVRHVPVRLTGILFLVALALAVELSALTIGAILSTALLIGPAATAFRLTKRVGMAAILAPVIGVFCAWLGIVVSYDSYHWFHADRSWPVSFCIVAVVFLVYLAAGLPRGRKGVVARVR
ncbi:MAG TPA: metal ABC transporter permease [Lacisediminihabitans sp.]|uniref:metal ABC transporter permease n=1 Tax=Lacisediminihabitans sp. TaxID=2787631 RepID=UPI002ED7E20C